ncbi:MAG: tRNA (adenosine(37)-N6)-threonylcarbamoyltransferase complex transferase subunit TsaD [Actinobacteria bacterium]|nr:MAG: tRNA (adenosine(37)-N6)-threonylcarbamoyltransferase complex transferase subunit TsaD [Actinomycetota bacterium]
MFTILGLETSCDDTSAALVTSEYSILSNVISSQVQFHQKYGGVVPEIASRHHLQLLSPVIEEAIKEARLSFDDIDAVACTAGPGLVGSLLVGISAAKSISLAQNIPLIALNHIEGHIFANFLNKIAAPSARNDDFDFPFVCLVVSGGHTSLVYVEDFGKYELMGQTVDDAAGEAYDKVAKYLGLGYPGGPIVEKEALKGDPSSIKFSRPMMDSRDYNFSFSGIKTAVVYYIDKLKKETQPVRVPDICASFQQAIVDVLVTKTIKAAVAKQVKTIALAGGVASNAYLRQGFKLALNKTELNLVYPPSVLCTDNAAMIAAAAIYKYKNSDYADLSATVDANLVL